MSTVVTPRRTPAERALLEQMRADAWRFDEPAAREANLIQIMRDAPGAYSAFELNVLYEMICLSPTVLSLIRAEAHEHFDPERAGTMSLEEAIPAWLGQAVTYDEEEVLTIGDVPRMPFQLIVAVAALAAGTMSADGVERTLDVWRRHTTTMRKAWTGWAKPDVMPTLVATTIAHAERAQVKGGMLKRADAMRSVLTLACESLIRITWLFECEAADSITFGPVSDRRLPRDPAEAVIALRHFTEQQPELRKVPAFVHVATAGTRWLRPRDYYRLRVPHADDEQTAAVALDAMRNRHYLHDHVAVIEVDRKPWKMLVLAPEYRDRIRDIVYLDAILVHEKGSFVAEVMIRGDDEDSLVVGLVLPFGSHAWRGAPTKEEVPNVRLPPDSSVVALIVAAWRDLIVAKVREEQYEQKVERDDDAKSAKRAERKAKRGHIRVVRYLPRMVAARREEEAERADTGKTGVMRRAYRVGTFAKVLQEGHRRSAEASAFAEEIGMPLRDNQTIVKPHIRGGTEEEREALLLQDDVRLWRSWAAVDLLFATRSPGSLE